MACTKKDAPWTREMIDALHKGREVVDGRPRKTYQELGKELGRSPLQVQKAAQRYGLTRRGRYGHPWFTNSQLAEINKIIEDGVQVRLMCAAELEKLLMSRGYKVSKPTIRTYVRNLGFDVYNQYVKNVMRKRRHSAELATLRRLAKMSSKRKEIS